MYKKNVSIYNDGAQPDKSCAEFFSLILNYANQDCLCIPYSEYKKGGITAGNISVVGGALTGQFPYTRIFAGSDRYDTAQKVLEYLKQYY